MHILSGKKNSKIRLFPALAIIPLFLLFCYQIPVSVNQPLDTPTGVTAIAVSESSINVSWNDIAQDVEGFIVERAATGGTAAADWTAVNDADTNTYNDTNLSPQTNYFYRVMAYSGNIKSNYSAVVNATTQAIGTPAAPSGFTAAVLSSSSIRLTWTDNSNNETGFILEYSTGNSNWTQLTSSNVTTYDHTGCTAGTLYSYRVRAYNGAGQSTDVTVSATTQQVIPVAPSNLSASVQSSSRIILTWADNSSNEQGFILEYSVDNNNWTQLTSSNVTSFDHTGLLPATLYYYRVRAYNSAGSSTNVTVSTTTQQAVPAAPSNLSASVQLSSRIILTWTDNSSNEQGFILEYSLDNNNWTQLTSANVTTYDHTGLTASTTYNYRVRAYNSAGASANATLSATTPAASVSTQIIADHTVVAQYDRIPQVWINEVKKMWVSYAGESHSSGIRKGAVLLETLNSKFAVSVIESGTPQAYTAENLRLSRATRGDVSTSNAWVYSYGEEDWFTTANAISQTKAGLDYCNTTGPALAVLAFGWCWDHDVYINSTSINAYLSATQQYIDYCTTKGYSTKVIFTTGPVDNNGYSAQDFYNRYISSRQIRTYVAADSSRILFDYADILAWSNGGEENTSTYNGNIYNLIHSNNMLDYNADWTTTSHSEDGDHIGEVGALRLAKAMWWVLARIAGWDGISTD